MQKAGFLTTRLICWFWRTVTQCIFLPLLKLVKIAKKLKKEKVNVDVVNFGEEVNTLRSHDRSLDKNILDTINIAYFSIIK